MVPGQATEIPVGIVYADSHVSVEIVFHSTAIAHTAHLIAALKINFVPLDIPAPAKSAGESFRKRSGKLSAEGKGGKRRR